MFFTCIAARPRRRTRREFGIINIRLNTVQGGCQAKVYKFNNRKDDVVFSKDNCCCRYVTPNSMYTRANSRTKKGARWVFGFYVLLLFYLL